jgi:hypothetical protein
MTFETSWHLFPDYQGIDHNDHVTFEATGLQFASTSRILKTSLNVFFFSVGRHPFDTDILWLLKSKYTSSNARPANDSQEARQFNSESKKNKSKSKKKVSSRQIPLPASTISIH